MTSNHLENAEKEEPIHAPFRLSYELYLAVDSKPLYVNTFGEKQLSRLNLYGPHAGIDLVVIDIGYGQGETEFEQSDFLNYIKLLYPNYEVKESINKRGFDAYTYKIRDDVFFGVVFESPGQITYWSFLFSGDYDEISSSIQKWSEDYDSHFYE